MLVHLPGGVLVAKVTPLDQDLPARSGLAGASAQEGAGLHPGRLRQQNRLCLISPLEVDKLALGNLHQNGLHYPFVVHMCLANPLDQVLWLPV